MDRELGKQESGQRSVRRPDALQDRIDEAPALEDDVPTQRPQQVARQERDREQEEQRQGILAPPHLDPDEIGDCESEDEGDRGLRDGDPQRLQEDVEPPGRETSDAQELLVGARREAGDEPIVLDGPEAPGED